MHSPPDGPLRATRSKIIILRLLIVDFGADPANGCALVLTSVDVETFVRSGLGKNWIVMFQRAFRTACELPCEEENGEEKKLRRAKGCDAMGFAVWRENHDLARLLAKKLGADVGDVDDFGYTPLLNAAKDGHAEMMRLLVKELGASARREEGLRWPDPPSYHRGGRPLRCGPNARARAWRRRWGKG